jgi:ferric-dicitrate binding protein FerR (iron transport regulator)
MRRGGNENLRPGARLFDVVREATAGELDEEASLSGRDRFLGVLGRGSRHAHLAFVLWGGLGVVVAMATAARIGRPAPIAMDSTDAEVSRRATYGNGYVSAGASSKPTVRFAGASHIDFAAGSRGRIGELSPTRARVVLEGGQASVHGEAHPREGILVEAGPYALKGGGGAFDVSWSGSVLQVRVASGAVVVEGPAAREGLTLREDQSFEARDANEDVRCF